jgi:hypothetical protein
LETVRGVKMQVRAKQQIGSGVVRTSLRPLAELQHAFHWWCGQRRRSFHRCVR